MARAFIIRPFGMKQAAFGRVIDFERVHEQLISPALKASEGLTGATTGEIIEAGNIHEDIFALLLGADLVICDITVPNANVFYELGVRHALRKRHTVLIKGETTEIGTPFDLLTDRYLAYPIDDPGAAKESLEKLIRTVLRSEQPTDSPIFQMLPLLNEADPVDVLQVVPPDFREEVERARAAGANGRGWLRLLSAEVRTLRFQWQGLKLVANAQWKLGDYKGARQGWEAVRDNQPEDVDANLTLANVYERLYRERRDPELLEASHRAIERVLRQDRATGLRVRSALGALTVGARAEGLALEARNQKTRWRLQFEDHATIEERREAAMNPALRNSYEAYRQAYFEDLNAYYPGLSALQMGTIMLHLSKDSKWLDAFDSDEDAEVARRQIEHDVASLKTLVTTALENALRNQPRADPSRVWAELSKADISFLDPDAREQRVISRYRDAIPSDIPFAWDATRAQLELFASLGVRAELARAVIETLDAQFLGRREYVEAKPLHLVVFAGHGIDAPDRATPRFPADREDLARQLIRTAFETLLKEGHDVASLASAAPGADILWHEICTELGIQSTICLPMPANDFARLAFRGLDSWRTRFLDLADSHETLVLSDRASLPHWLARSGVDPQERASKWVMEMALARGADRGVSLVALWDGGVGGDAPGGPGQMVKLARDAGTVFIKIIDTTALLD